MSLGATSTPKAGADAQGRRLESWKEIAAYLGRDVTTVRRWEKGEGCRFTGMFITSSVRCTRTQQKWMGCMEE